MMTGIAELLDVYKNRLNALGWHGAELLTSGHDESYVREFFKRIDLSPTEELVEFFLKTNGADKYCGKTLDQIVLIPVYFALSLEEGINTSADLAQNRPDCHGLFPFFGNDMGDFLLVDVRIPSDTRGSVFELAEGYSPTRIHSSIETFISTYIAAAEARILFIDKDGGLDVAFEKLSMLARKMNPSISFWQ